VAPESDWSFIVGAVAADKLRPARGNGCRPWVDRLPGQRPQV